MPTITPASPAAQTPTERFARLATTLPAVWAVTPSPRGSRDTNAGRRRAAFAGLLALSGRWLLALALLAGLLTPAAAEPADISVRAADRKADGKSWRGSGAIFMPLPGMGGVTPQMEVKSAPSMVLCTVSLAGDLACPGSKGRDSKGRLGSPCHLSIDCDFTDIELPPDDAFGVIVISHGIIFTSLVDAIVVSRKKISTKDALFATVDDLLRQASEKLAPSGSGDERQRRMRPFPLKTLDACSLASCSLRQSEFKLVPQ